MGLEEEDDVTAMEMDLMNNGDFGTSDSNKNKLKIRLFINMDDNDKGNQKINVDDIFKRKDKDFPFYIDVSYIYH